LSENVTFCIIQCCQTFIHVKDSLFASSILELSPNIAYGLWADTFMHMLIRRIIIVIIFCGSNRLTFLIFVILWLRFQYPSMLFPHSVYIPHLFAGNNQDYLFWLLIQYFLQTLHVKLQFSYNYKQFAVLNNVKKPIFTSF
jgi:hypothetical protein